MTAETQLTADLCNLCDQVSSGKTSAYPRLMASLDKALKGKHDATLIHAYAAMDARHRSCLGTALNQALSLVALTNNRLAHVFAIPLILRIELGTEASNGWIHGRVKGTLSRLESSLSESLRHTVRLVSGLYPQSALNKPSDVYHAARYAALYPTDIRESWEAAEFGTELIPGEHRLVLRYFLGAILESDETPQEFDWGQISQWAEANVIELMPEAAASISHAHFLQAEPLAVALDKGQANYAGISLRDWIDNKDVRPPIVRMLDPHYLGQMQYGVKGTPESGGLPFELMVAYLYAGETAVIQEVEKWIPAPWNPVQVLTEPDYAVFTSWAQP